MKKYFFSWIAKTEEQKILFLFGLIFAILDTSIFLSPYFEGVRLKNFLFFKILGSGVQFIILSVFNNGREHLKRNMIASIPSFGFWYSIYFFLKKIKK